MDIARQTTESNSVIWKFERPSNLYRIQSVISRVLNSISTDCERDRRTIFVCVMVLIYDPECITNKRNLDRRVRLRNKLAKALDVNCPAISKQVTKSKVFYEYYPWFRDQVNEVLKDLNNK